MRKLKLPEGQTVYEGTVIILGGILVCAALAKLSGCDGPREIGVNKENHTMGNLSINVTNHQTVLPTPSHKLIYVPIPAPLPVVTKTRATMAECPYAERQN